MKITVLASLLALSVCICMPPVLSKDKAPKTNSKSGSNKSSGSKASSGSAASSGSEASSSAASTSKQDSNSASSTKNLLGDLKPDEIGIQSKIGTQYFVQKKYSQAATIFQNLVEDLKKESGSDLSLSEAYFDLALCQKEDGKTAEAKENEALANSIRVKLRIPETRKGQIQEIAPTAALRKQIGIMFKEVNDIIDGKDPLYASKFSEANDAAFATMMTQSWNFRESGELIKAIAAGRAGLALANKSEHPNKMVVSALNALAGIYRISGRTMAALMLYNAAMEEQEKFKKTDDPLLATLFDNTALVSLELGDPEKARDLQEKALTIYRKVLPADSKDLGQTLSNIAETYDKLEMPDKAIQYLNEALTVLKKTKAEDDPSVLTTMDNLAASYSRKGELAKAESMQSTVVAGLKKHYTKNPLLAEALANYAHTLVRLKKFDQAIDYQKQSTQMFIAIFGEEHPRAIRSRLAYATVLKVAGKEKEAQAEFESIPKY